MVVRTIQSKNEWNKRAHEFRFVLSLAGSSCSNGNCHQHGGYPGGRDKFTLVFVIKIKKKLFLYTFIVLALSGNNHYYYPSTIGLCVGNNVCDGTNQTIGLSKSNFQVSTVML